MSTTLLLLPEFLIGNVEAYTSFTDTITQVMRSNRGQTVAVKHSNQTAVVKQRSNPDPEFLIGRASSRRTGDAVK